jgi:hypothetical protein
MKYLALVLIVATSITPVLSQQTSPRISQDKTDSAEVSAKKLIRSIILGDTSVFLKYIPDVDLEMKMYFGESIPDIESYEIKRRIEGYMTNASSRASSAMLQFHEIHKELNALGLSANASVDIVKSMHYPARKEPNFGLIPVLQFQAVIHQQNIYYGLDLWGYFKADVGWQLWRMIKTIDVAVKVYDNTGRVDLKKSSQYSLAENVRFNGLDTTFVARYEDFWYPSASFEIEKEGSKMKITNIDQFDSVKFQEGEFFCPTGAKKNTLFRNIELGNSIFNIYNDRNWLGINTAFKTESIQKKNYLTVRKKYKPKINKDSSNVIWSDSTFTFNIGKTYYTLWSTCDRNHSLIFGRGCSDYRGYINPLNLHIVEWGGDETSFSFLVDSKRMIQYHFLPSLDRSSFFQVSPKNNFLLVYGTDFYSDPGFSYIALLKINWSGNEYSLADFGALDMIGSPIKEVVWINESSFAIHKDDETYLKVTFK